MRKLIFLLPITFFLASCGDGSKIKDVVRQNLKDPESAQFKEAVFSADKKRACIIWNAKNSMGGYGEWDVAELKIENSEWTIKNMEGSERNCSETDFTALDAGEKAEFDAELKAIEILQKVKSISSKEASELAISGKCSELVQRYAFNSKYVAEYQVRQDIDMLQLYEESLKETQAKLDAGDC